MITQLQPRYAGITLILCLLFSGCGEGLVQPAQKELAVINAGEALGPDVNLPNVVSSGEEFEVTFSTHSPDCYEDAGTEVTRHEGMVHIYPYTRPTGARACLSSGWSYRRTISLNISEPGEAQVVLHGKDLQGDKEVEISISFDILVTGN